MQSINISLPVSHLRDILYAVKEDSKSILLRLSVYKLLLSSTAIAGRVIEFEEFVFLSLFLARYLKRTDSEFYS